MLTKKPLLLFVFLILSLRAFSAVFTVTSNADSGPGTLRDALTQAAANGTGSTDYINFNLPGNTTAAITITLFTALPDVTGNIIIDGTTQPGATLGVSNAKVIITVATPSLNLNGFNISALVNVNDTVEFFGLFIKGFSIQQFGGGAGISNTNPCNLTIGAPGKGNVICGNSYAITGELRNTTIQSNFIGVDPDGETADPNWYMIYTGFDFSNLLIGGDSQQDGNVLVGSYQNDINIGNGTDSFGSENVIIKNNYFGTDYKCINVINTAIPGDYINAYVPALDLQVNDNVFAAGANAIEILGVGNVTATVTGNFFGTDKTQTHTLGTGGQAIQTNGFVDMTIGGSGTLQNVFTGYFNPILTPAEQSSTDVIENKFYCNNVVELSPVRGNYIRIIKLFDNEVSGDAPPGATVQLYYSTTQCTTCNPNTWFATVSADANGIWDYQGDTRQNVMASSTVGGNTIGFEPYFISPDQVTIVNNDCHHKGSLEITEKRYGRFQFKWTDSKGNIIGTGQKIDNLAPGEYKVEINEGGMCPTATGTFDIIDLTPQVYPQTFQLDCNNTTGYFTAVDQTAQQNITVSSYYWEDASGNVISTTATVKDLPAGNYYLYITDSNGCASTKELYQVLPPVGAPTIDGSKASVQPSDCGSSNGWIKGLQVDVSAAILYGWNRSDDTPVAYNVIDLTGVPAGNYYFFVEYSSNCPPVKSPVYTVPETNGITMDESAAQSTVASCNVNNGSVTGIKVTGATQYQWTDSNGKTAGASPDLQGVAAGTYTLTASNGFGCTVTSKSYQVAPLPPTKFPAYTDNIITACYQSSNGSVTVNTDGLVKSARWINAQGTPAGSGSTLSNVPAGSYQLYLTDQNGCESYYNTYTVTQYAALAATDNGTVTNDQCTLSTGSISGETIAGGEPPYTYTWYNSANQQIGSAVSISNLPAGNYSLKVSDSGCGALTLSYQLTDQMEDVPPPSVSNVALCSSGSAIISVNDPSASTMYRLYANSNDAQPLFEQKGGFFTVKVTGNTRFYVSQLNGSCESSRAQVMVTVGLSALNIANTFTPNGDGVNDLWQINGIANYPQSEVQVFTRWGQRVFDSKGYAVPFDGTFNGKNLPDGVYYYIINLNTNCSLLSGSLTIIR